MTAAVEARSDALGLFLELAAIPSASRRERAVTDRCIAYLRDLGLDPHEDAPPLPGDQAGNVICRIPATAGETGTPIMLCAHVDTVEPTAPIDPVVAGGVVTNANATILGGDNKAAVASMLEAIRRIVAEHRPHAGIELILSVQEEIGLLGVKAIDCSQLAARVGYVYDHAAPIGGLVTSCPSQYSIDATFLGRAAHAGIAPEEGRNAIAAAAHALAEMRFGRLDDETTANVGTIAGGLARNVVADRCEVRLEVRSRDHQRALKESQAMLDSLAHAANAAECELETSATLEYHAYKLRRTDPVVQIAWAALESCGITPELQATGGGADAHVFNANGIPCVNIANGMELIHTADERIAVADVDMMVDVSLALVEGARTTA
ncbi:MAG TPA: M20/M25/M40 family metallo-hydrolase [Gaiellales bacterium]|nr:M20/M25/M40 family metallo-hydrolase [Gaiellales bacterium]